MGKITNSNYLTKDLSRSKHFNCLAIRDILFRAQIIKVFTELIHMRQVTNTLLTQVCVCFRDEREESQREPEADRECLEGVRYQYCDIIAVGLLAHGPEFLAQKLVIVHAEEAELEQSLQILAH